LTKYGREYLKYPKLAELHYELFNKTPNHLHNAFNDVLICLKCFLKLRYDLDVTGPLKDLTHALL
jgi:DNA polymerase III epsilon subunit-like protein